MKKLVIFPLLFSIYPILFLYSYNVQELVINQLIAPLIISFAITLALWLTLNKLINNKEKTSLMVIVFILIFFYYGYLSDGLSVFNFKNRHIIPISLILGGYLCYFIYRMKNEIAINISKVLNIVVIVIVSINLLNITFFELKKITINRADNIPTKNISYRSSNAPDIYYIILDEFASINTIKNIWNYDAGEFVSRIEKLGFFIATESESKSTDTLCSIASSLNMENLKFKKDKLLFYQKINQNKVMGFLKSRGYKTLVFDNLKNVVFPAKGEILADIHFNFSEGRDGYLLNEFTQKIFQGTMMRPFIYLFFSDKYSNRDPNEAPYRNSTLYTINELHKLPKAVKGPKFIYAHLICPHPPFVFTTTGDWVNPLHTQDWREKKYYLEQYIYITKQIELLADSLIKNSKNPPIIILQSDHGPRSRREYNFIVPKKDMHKILNAYYLPGFPQNQLNKKISPVNSFRLIFKHYFNEPYNLLEDN